MDEPRTGPELASEHLAALASPSARARKEAALALKALGPEARASFAVLAQVAIHDPNPAVRDAASQALAVVDADGEATVLLASSLDDDRLATRVRALVVIEAMGERAARACAKVASLALQDEDDGVRDAAIATLSAIGRGRPEHDWLPAALDSPDVPVRRRAVACAAALAEAAAPAAGQLSRALQDDDEECRRGAALALVRLGPLAASAVPHLEAALSDPAVRLFAAMALGRIGPAASAALPALQAALSDPSAEAAVRTAIDSIAGSER